MAKIGKIYSAAPLKKGLYLINGQIQAWRLTLRSHHETSGIVKLLLPPQQGRGDLLCLFRLPG